jgi:hypothetical protein
VIPVIMSVSTFTTDVILFSYKSYLTFPVDI